LISRLWLAGRACALDRIGDEAAPPGGDDPGEQRQTRQDKPVRDVSQTARGIVGRQNDVREKLCRVLPYDEHGHKSCRGPQKDDELFADHA
jgi:hypothetical protein